MATAGYPESRAETVARTLSHTHGHHALSRARQRRATAEARGNHRQIDFYVAVCTIIADRHQTFSRSRATG